MSKASQRYVSPELSHFVGRSLLGQPDEQYALLVSILRGGHLRTRPDDPNTGRTGIRFHAPLHPESAGRYRHALVCFCDIPEADIGIHVRKYGPFGLAVSKTHAALHGARPVLYVPASTRWGVTYANDDYSIAQRLNALVESLGETQSAFFSEDPLLPHEHPFRARVQAVLIELVDHELLQYVKVFDLDTVDEDDENFYMEREWRTARDVPFSMDEVVRIYIPRRFAAQLRNDLPDYVNQVTFVD